MNIVLHEPEQPGNTATIGRTCVAAGASLHLIYPLGFHLTDKLIKRAGMDYWDRLELYKYDDWKDFLEKKPDADIYFATTKAKRTYDEVSYSQDSFIMFGAESKGIPEEILVEYPERCVRIPMVGDERSINLANSVSIILYEALRQNGFPDMNLTGELHRLQWIL